MVNALLDTNVSVDMEDNGRPISILAAEVIQQSRGYVDFFIHELQLEDINNDANRDRRNLLLSRIRRFKQIANPPVPSAEIRIIRESILD